MLVLDVLLIPVNAFALLDLHVKLAKLAKQVIIYWLQQTRLKGK